MSEPETKTYQPAFEVFNPTESSDAVEPNQLVAAYHEDLMSIVKSTDMESVGSRIAKKEEVVDFFIDSLIDNGGYSNSEGYQQDYGSLLEKFVEELLPESSRPSSESAAASVLAPLVKTGYNTEAPGVIPITESVSDNYGQYYSQPDDLKNYSDKKVGFNINDFLDELIPEYHTHPSPSPTRPTPSPAHPTPSPTHPTPSPKPAEAPVFLPAQGGPRYNSQTPIVIPLRGLGSFQPVDNSQIYSQPEDLKNYNGVQYEGDNFNFQDEIVQQNFGSSLSSYTQQPPYVPGLITNQDKVDLAITEHDSVLSILDSFLDNIIPVSKHSDFDMMENMKHQLMDTIAAESKSQGSSHNLILLQSLDDSSSAEEYSEAVQQNVLDVDDEKVGISLLCKFF